MKPTNPNGANQYLLDPRQKLCWENYANPKSETFGKLIQSALAAGYEESYADTVSQSDWFCAKMWRLNSVFTSEKKMKQLMELDLLNGGDRVDIGIARIQADLAKFMASTQGKDDGYSTKTETDITTNGESINTPMTPAILEATRKYEEEMKKAIL